MIALFASVAAICVTSLVGFRMWLRFRLTLVDRGDGKIKDLSERIAKLEAARAGFGR